MTSSKRWPIRPAAPSSTNSPPAAPDASALREGLPISQSAMSQHLAVLRNAGLVREAKQGRCVNYQVDPDGLAQIAHWLAKYRAWWPARIDALQTLLKDMDQ